MKVKVYSADGSEIASGEVLSSADLFSQDIVRHELPDGSSRAYTVRLLEVYAQSGALLVVDAAQVPYQDGMLHQVGAARRLVIRKTP